MPLERVAPTPMEEGTLVPRPSHPSIIMDIQCPLLDYSWVCTQVSKDVFWPLFPSNQALEAIDTPSVPLYGSIQCLRSMRMAAFIGLAMATFALNPYLIQKHHVGVIVIPIGTYVLASGLSLPCGNEWPTWPTIFFSFKGAYLVLCRVECIDTIYWWVSMVTWLNCCVLPLGCMNVVFELLNDTVLFFPLLFVLNVRSKFFYSNQCQLVCIPSQTLTWNFLTL